MVQTAETLFDGKKRDEILDKIKQIPLSDSTVMRRTKILAEDLVLQLNEKLKSTNLIPLAFDESADMTNYSQLIVFVSSGGYSNSGARGKNFQKFMFSKKKRL